MVILRPAAGKKMMHQIRLLRVRLVAAVRHARQQLLPTPDNLAYLNVAINE